MASFPCVHHIEVGVVDGPGAVDILTSQYTFRVRAVRSTEVADQWLLVKNDTRFLITSLKSQDSQRIQKDDLVIDWAASVDPDASPATISPRKDSVFNVAFQVKNITSCTERLRSHGVVFSKPLHTVTDSIGSVQTCAIKSCVGDIHHTLLDKRDYPGFFLPGFTPVSEDDTDNVNSPDSMLTCFDHVAVTVRMNTAMSVIAWYENCFGMKRFLINPDEDEDDGLVLSSDTVGLRLRAMEYWKCAEVGLVVPSEPGLTSRLSMVVAEGLPPYPGSTEENQIESWIRQHGGPGIQHVAIRSSDIKITVTNLKLCGATFANPPPDAYYTEAGRLHDILRAKEDVAALKNNGILIDTEADRTHEISHNQKIGKRQDSYLLQIFTKPVFRKDPFFLEIIQREGATGFGSGNVAALYRSVQAYIVGREEQEKRS